MRVSVVLALALIGCCYADPKPRPIACGGTGAYKYITMRNPADLPTNCVYKIQPMNANVCQLRVDFDMILQQPTVATDSVPKCESDSFKIAGLELCGINRNQHVYIPVQVTRDNRRQTIDLHLKIANRKENPSLGYVSWNINVRQLECVKDMSPVITGRIASPMTPMLARAVTADMELLAPHGCLQYHSGARGTIETFNFNGGNGPYLPNLDYAICLRRRVWNKNIEFNFNSFSMSSIKADAEGFDENCLQKVIATPGKAADGDGKTTEAPANPPALPDEDYLMIPSAETSKNQRVTKFCGNTVNAQKVAANITGPYVLQFHSDNKYTAPAKEGAAANNIEGGFSIQYKIL